MESGEPSVKPRNASAHTCFSVSSSWYRSAVWCFVVCVGSSGAACPTSLHGQGRWAVAAGAHRATVGNASAALGMTADIGRRLAPDSRYLFLRGYWWDTASARAGVGLYYGGRGTKWRFIYADFGVTAISAKNAAGRTLLHPGVGWTLAGVLDLARHVQIRLGGGYLWDTKLTTRSLGASICFCPDS